MATVINVRIALECDVIRCELGSHPQGWPYIRHGRRAHPEATRILGGGSGPLAVRLLRELTRVSGCMLHKHRRTSPAYQRRCRADSDSSGVLPALSLRGGSCAAHGRLHARRSQRRDRYCESRSGRHRSSVLAHADDASGLCSKRSSTQTVQIDIRQFPRGG